MIKAHQIVRSGQWDTAHAVGAITLDYDHRYRRRIRLRSDQGLDILLELPEAVHIRAGDGLDCGPDGVVLVQAAVEAIAEISGDPALLIRLAWHLGNRHLDVAFGDQTLLIRADHVIEAMVHGLGGQVVRRMAAFDPESGAYAHDHG